MKTTMTAVALVLALGTSAYAQEVKTPVTPATPITMPAEPMAKPADTATKPVKMININTVTVTDLEKLPKIGEARAKLIVASRPYKSVDELLAKKIIPQDAFDAVKSLVSVK